MKTIKLNRTTVSLSARELRILAVILDDWNEWLRNEICWIDDWKESKKLCGELWQACYAAEEAEGSSEYPKPIGVFAPAPEAE